MSVEGSRLRVRASACARGGGKSLKETKSKRKEVIAFQI